MFRHRHRACDVSVRHVVIERPREIGDSIVEEKQSSLGRAKPVPDVRQLVVGMPALPGCQGSLEVSQRLLMGMSREGSLTGKEAVLDELDRPQRCLGLGEVFVFVFFHQ